MEEVTKFVLASQRLRGQAEEASASASSAMTIPVTLHDLLMARLDQMGTAKGTAQLAATIGREFGFMLLQTVASVEEETLRQDLRRLVDAELLYQRGVGVQTTYVFKHALIQEAAYTSLLRRTRQHYHHWIAQALETQFPEVATERPELVAHHYTGAGLVEEAVSYWQRAAERANDRAANLEACSYLTKGLELLSALPESSTRLQSEVVLQTILGRVLNASKSYGDDAVVQAYTRARQLCQRLGNPSQLFPVLLGLSIYFVVRAELSTARELGEQLLQIAQRTQDPILLVEAHYVLGVTFSWSGEFVHSRQHLEQGIAYYDTAQHPAHLALYGQDGGPICLCRLAVVLWHLGYPDQALAQGHAALTLTEELAHPFSRAYVLTWLAFFYNHRRQAQEAQKWVDVALAFATEQGFPYWYTQGTVLQGWLFSVQGNVEMGIELMHQGLAAMQTVGTEVMQAYLLGLLARAYGKSGQLEESLTVVHEALSKVNTWGERWPEAEIHRLKGELLLQTNPTGQVQEAESSFRQALQVARCQHAKLLELRAAMSLSRLWQQQGRRDAARQVLTEVYKWFTEGFDTVDLQEARELLEQLA